MMTYFEATLHQILFRPGLRTRPHLGRGLQRSPESYLDFMGLLLKGRIGRRGYRRTKEKRERRKGMKAIGRRGWGGKGKETEEKVGTEKGGKGGACPAN